MKYLILAEICLTVGTPDWVVIFCWVFFGLDVARAITDTLAIIIHEKYVKKN